MNLRDCGEASMSEYHFISLSLHSLHKRKSMMSLFYSILPRGYEHGKTHHFESKHNHIMDTALALELCLSGLANNSLFLSPFRKKILICLKGNLMAPCQGKTLFCTSQQLPCLRLTPLMSLLSWLGTPFKGPWHASRTVFGTTEKQVWCNRRVSPTTLS